MRAGLATTFEKRYRCIRKGTKKSNKHDYRVTECKGNDYEKRLECVNLTMLEMQRERADMLEVYKIMNGGSCRERLIYKRLEL